MKTIPPRLRPRLEMLARRPAAIKIPNAYRPKPNLYFSQFSLGQRPTRPYSSSPPPRPCPAAGTWARRHDSRRDRARRLAGLREQAQPSAARGWERAAGAAGVRQQRVHDGRWLAGGATAGGCGGGLRGGVTAGGCLGTQTTACWAAGRRAASNGARHKEGRQQQQGPRSIEQSEVWILYHRAPL